MDLLRESLSALEVERGLDVATRDGGFAWEVLLGLKSCGEMVAMDIKDAGFEKGREKCKGMPVTFMLGNACAMPFADGSFELVCIGNSLHHIPDLAALFKELRRVLAPAGLLLIGEMYTDGQPAGSLTHWILHSLDCDMDNADGTYHAPTFPKAQLLQLVGGAGFRVEKTLCDRKNDPKVLEKLRERIANVPEKLEKYRGMPQYAAMAAKAAWLREEYESHGIASAEQLVLFARG